MPPSPKWCFFLWGSWHFNGTPKNITCPIHLTLLFPITLIILGVYYKLQKPATVMEMQLWFCHFSVHTARPKLIPISWVTIHYRRCQSPSHKQHVSCGRKEMYHDTMYTHRARIVRDPGSTGITFYPVYSVHSTSLEVRRCPGQNYCWLVHKSYR